MLSKNKTILMILIMLLINPVLAQATNDEDDGGELDGFRDFGPVTWTEYNIPAYGARERNFACQKVYLYVKVQDLILASMKCVNVTVLQCEHDNRDNVKYVLYSGVLNEGDTTPKLYTQGSLRYWDQVWVRVENMNGTTLNKSEIRVWGQETT